MFFQLEITVYFFRPSRRNAWIGIVLCNVLALTLLTHAPLWYPMTRDATLIFGLVALFGSGYCLTSLLVTRRRP